MRIDWSDLQRHDAGRLQGCRVEIEGWFAAPDPDHHDHARFFLTEEPACCTACLPQGDSGRRLVVEAALPVAATGRPMRLSGILQRQKNAGWTLQQARSIAAQEHLVAPGFTRRAALAGGLAAAGLAAWMPAGDSRAATADPDAGRQAIADHVTMDLHSHAGRVLIGRDNSLDRPFRPLAGPMRAGGMAVISLAVVADHPATHIEEKRIRAYRNPAPGELYAYIIESFGRLQALVERERLGIIRGRQDLAAAGAERPAVIVCSEGGDFLEGSADRVDEAFERWHLRQLQLTHYRVNELGDIQTEKPQHGGLTDAGAAVIRRCNRRGIAVDVAHGTYDLVKRAASVTEKPLVLSHTSLNPKPGRFSRTISPDHARAIAETGGIIGLWPPGSIFPDMAALAEGFARMVEVAGIDHVGLGSDMLGLLSPAVFSDYAQLPDLAGALLAQGFSAEETAKLLGGNAARVFAACLA